MSSGQLLNVLVCSTTDLGSGNGQIFGPIADATCPAGMNAFVVNSYVPFATSQSVFDGLGLPFDPLVASGIFSFAFGIIVFFWLLGLKGSILLKPFWGKRTY